MTLTHQKNTTTTSQDLSNIDLRIDISRGEARHRQEMWSAYMERFWCCYTPTVDISELQLDLSCRLLDTSMLSQMTLSGGEFRSTRRDLLDCYLIRYQTAGDLFVHADGSVREGALGIIDLSARLEFHAATSSYTYLVIAKSVLQTPGVDLEPIYLFDKSTAIGRLVLENFFHVVNEAKACSTQGGELVTLLSTLLRTIIAGNREIKSHEEPMVMRSKRVRAERYVLRHSAEDNLDVNKMCIDLGMSRATLYRLFQEEGGIRSYAKRVRLERLYRDLEVTRPLRGAVSSVSERYGFFDRSHLARMFRQTYGASPSDVVGRRLAKDIGHVDDLAQQNGSAATQSQRFMDILQVMRHRHLGDISSDARVSD